MTIGPSGSKEIRLADYIVRALMNFNDVSYEDNVDLLYELAGQVVSHLKSYLTEEQIDKVLRYHERPLANFIYAQMQNHYWEDVLDYEVEVRAGFSELKDNSQTGSGEPPRNFRESPEDKSNLAKYIFGGFLRCLFGTQKFQSDSERRLAVILDRESLKWFRPALGQFKIYYKVAADPSEYQPDFVAETESSKYILEAKDKDEMKDPAVLAKRDAAVKWCEHATLHEASCGGKPWKYLLIPHDVIKDNMTIDGLERSYRAL